MDSIGENPADSATKKKKKKMELDRISNLPGDVTENILSRLPIKDAVRTSVLSTTWRHKWAMLRHLVFDDLCVSRGKKSNKTLETIVDHVLLLHNGPVEAFRLCTRKRLDSSSVDRWILHLLRNSSSIKEFVLKLMWNKSSWAEEVPYNISSCLFLYPELTHLELSECLVKPPTTFKGFPRLESLDIQNVTVAQDVLEKLIVLCPLLERINLCDLKDITHLQIDAPNLQHLRVGSLGFLLEKLIVCCPLLERMNLCDSKHIAHLQIDAPNLQHLGVSRGAFQDLKLTNSPNLVGLKVTSFRGAKAEVDVLKHVLFSSPALQELEISFGYKMKMMRLADNQCCTSTQLRSLKVTGFCGRSTNEIDFIRFLLSSSPSLSRMTLQPTTDYISWDFPIMLEDFKHVKKIFMDQKDTSYSDDDYDDDY